jgi:hypothetical protein
MSLRSTTFVTSRAVAGLIQNGVGSDLSQIDSLPGGNSWSALLRGRGMFRNPKIANAASGVCPLSVGAV